MAAAAEPGRTAIPYDDVGATSSGLGWRRDALSEADLAEWVKSKMRIVAAVGVTAVGTFACAGAFTGVGAVGCAAAIAYVASSILPANASEPGFEALPPPDTPAALMEFQATVDAAYACPAGYDTCGEDYCINLASVYRHCGACGNVCESGVCVDGACAPAPVVVGDCTVQVSCADDVCVASDDQLYHYHEDYVTLEVSCGDGAACHCTDPCCTDCDVDLCTGSDYDHFIRQTCGCL